MVVGVGGGDGVVFLRCEVFGLNVTKGSICDNFAVEVGPGRILLNLQNFI